MVAVPWPHLLASPLLGLTMAKWIPAGPLAQVLRGEGLVTPALKAAAEKVGRRTKAHRRMQSSPEKYGELVVTEEDDGTVTLAATGPLAHLEEWGSVNNPAYASMRRAVASEGYDFKEAE